MNIKQSKSKEYFTKEYNRGQRKAIVDYLKSLKINVIVRANGSL
jgi:hypothetical protein